MSSKNLLREERKKSLVYTTLIDFVSKTAEGEAYQFTLDATDMLDPTKIVDADEAIERAQNFVHRMRVELSRLRSKVRKQRRVPKQFKMLLTKVEIVGDLIHVEITKSKGMISEVQEDVEQAFNVLTAGAMVNGK